QPRTRADRHRADGAHAVVQAAARRRRSRPRRGCEAKPGDGLMAAYASVYPLVSARAVAREFTYEVDDVVQVGSIVSVPFGRSRAGGIVVGLQEAPPPGVETRPVDAVVGSVPEPLVALALWLADYYGSTPARALALVAPRAPKRRKVQEPPAARQAI